MPSLTLYHCSRFLEYDRSTRSRYLESLARHEYNHVVLGLCAQALPAFISHGDTDGVGMVVVDSAQRAQKRLSAQEGPMTARRKNIEGTMNCRVAKLNGPLPAS